MTETVYIIVACVISVIVCVFFYSRLTGRISKITLALSAQSEQIALLKKQLQRANQDNEELRAGSIGMGSTIKTLNQSLQIIEAKQQELVNTDPEYKLYSKAAKLAVSGATVEELMQECELPRAEAELLISLHNKV